MVDLIDFILEELFLEGLGGPDYAKVSQLIQSLARNLQAREEGLPPEKIKHLWEFFRIYEQPPSEYEWVGEISDGRREYINRWILKILCRQAFRFDDRDLIAAILDLDSDSHSVVPYLTLRHLKFGNSVSLELVNRATCFGPKNTQAILVFLEHQLQYHLDALEALVPWLVSFLGMKPSGRGLKRVFHSDNSAKILVLFCKYAGVKTVVINACEALRFSKKKNIRVSIEALLTELAE